MALKATSNLTCSGVVWALCSLALMGCGSSTAPFDPSSYSDDPSSAQPTVVDFDSVDTLQNDAQLLNGLPSLAFQQTMADSGLTIGLAGSVVISDVDFHYVEQQWQNMQSCLSITAAAPLVVISGESLQVLSAEDDVLRYLDGSVIATSTRSAVGSVVQIALADFDGSLGEPGFHFRSIIGRFLWLNEGLAERDYPFDCARS
ncbi:MAG: hypothetical protein KTR35_20870 [Gammaproteobacteria bacterium]|nr:hypothetical protein [Gammaproteobacteria bacterium]